MAGRKQRRMNAPADTAAADPRRTAPQARPAQEEDDRAPSDYEREIDRVDAATRAQR
jgi:hypothetical protein